MNIIFWQQLKKPYYIISFALAFLLIVFFLTLNFLNFDRLPYGLSIGNFKIGGNKISQAEKNLNQEVEKFQNQKIALSFNNEKWLFSPAELGIKINSRETLSAATNFGHGSSLLAATAEQSTSLFFEQNVSPVYSLDSAKLNQSLASLSAIEKKPLNASLSYNPANGTFSIKQSQTGLTINRTQLVQEIINDFGQPAKTVYLSLVEQEPQIKEEDLAAAKDSAKALIDNAPYALKNEDAQSWKITKEMLSEWIEAIPGSAQNDPAQLSLNQDKIKIYLGSLAKTIDRQASNAKLTWENGEIKSILLAQSGQKLNIEKSAQKMTDGILAGEKTILLVIEKSEPGVSDQNIKELGLTSLLGKGESNFAGSASNRQHNIKVGSQKLNGWLIEPDEEFSFASAIGEIDGQNGWVEGLVIKNNQTIPEYGGGICQVSTTLFRAAVNSGLKITERQPHAYPIAYYNPPGFDATIYPPKPDLKFKNNTGGHLLLQNKIVGTKLTFEIYGRTDGRQVKIKGPTILSKGTDGSMKTILTQEIWRDGALVEKNDFRSNYKSPDLYPIVSASPTPAPSTSPTQ